MLRQDGIDLFILHELRRGKLPADVLREIRAFCQRGTALQCEQCAEVVLLYEGERVLSSGVPYYMLDDRCLCEKCSGIANRYARYKMLTEGKK